MNSDTAIELDATSEALDLTPTDTPQAVGASAGPVRDPVKKVIAASMVGIAIEFFDSYAYGTAAANYFPTVFFPKTDPTDAILASLPRTGGSATASTSQCSWCPSLTDNKTEIHH